MDNQPKVLRVNQTTALNANGTTSTDYVVTFQVGPHGPFMTTIPAAEFTSAAVMAKLNGLAAELAQLPMVG